MDEDWLIDTTKRINENAFRKKKHGNVTPYTTNNIYQKNKVKWNEKYYNILISIKKTQNIRSFGETTTNILFNVILHRCTLSFKKEIFSGVQNIRVMTFPDSMEEWNFNQLSCRNRIQIYSQEWKVLDFFFFFCILNDKSSIRVWRVLNKSKCKTWLV